MDKRAMPPRPRKRGFFVLEGLNAYASSFYFYYLFFDMAKEFGFGDRQNLCLAAVNGFVYMLTARFGGNFGQRHGHFTALRAGYSILTAGLAAGLFLHSLAGRVLALIIWTFGISFTWPTLEALISEHELPAQLPRQIGIYNLVWSGGSALAYFSGGAVLTWLGPQSLYWIPAAIHASQWALTHFLEPKTERVGARCGEGPELRPLPLNPRPIARARTFLKMGWWSNPFAYVAINTVAAVIPGLARVHHLSPLWAGVFCSLWFFSRWVTFGILWAWQGWHYHFGWLLAAYGCLLSGFAVLLEAPQLRVIIAAQVVFGAGLGLIYYSSLFYSMDAGEAKSEHGGIHESAIGTGIFAGPAVGATALTLFPAQPRMDAWAVSGLLMAGLTGMIWLYYRGRGAAGW